MEMIPKKAVVGNSCVHVCFWYFVYTSENVSRRLYWEKMDWFANEMRFLEEVASPVRVVISPSQTWVLKCFMLGVSIPR